MLDKPLRNARWELFAQGVAKGASATQAYKDAGYKAEGHSAEQQASATMRNHEVAARIAALKAKVVERVVEETGITMADVVAGLAKIAFNDAVTKGYDLDIKRKALCDIGKHLGGFVTRKEIGGPGQFDRMTTDELRQRVYERAEAVVAARRATEAAKRGGTSQGKPD
jgi:hypothetical protein